MWVSKAALQLSIAFIFFGILFASGPLIGLGVFLLLATLLARFWAKHALDNVHYERFIPENRAFEGETLSVTLRLINDKLLPLPWVELRDSVPDGVLIDEDHVSTSTSPGYVYLARSTHLSWYERISWPLEIKAPPRGYYRVGPARIRTGDIFGFFPVERDDDSFEPFIIYPRLYALPDLGLPAERPFGELKGRERIFEDPSRIAGMRDYRPGDPMRRIDWKASARAQALQSRVYEPSATMHLLVALNVDTMDHAWEGFLPEMLEHGLSVAGSVAQHAFEQGYAIGLVANGSYRDSDRPMRVPVSRSAEQLGRVLEALAVVGPMTPTSLDVVIDREALNFPFGATLVCVTNRMNDPLAASLRRVSNAGHSVTVIAMSDEQWESDLGRIRVYNIASALRALAAHSFQADGNGNGAHA
ncbi:MAG TPA: DUF58 domain-containing protein [Dehalococcoidia bacterium]|nr:DUF58 domain-containing protein [Dehalococcoidia bacterium]